MTPGRLRFGLRLVVVGLSLVVTACADDTKHRTTSKDVVVRETDLAKAVVRLGTALQVDDRRALDAAALEATRLTKDLAAWLDAHPPERTPEMARIVTAAEKLVAAADRLRTLLDQHAEDALLQQAAIDGLHRYNEFITAHQGEPALAELAMPAELRDRFMTMMERIGREVQANQPDCDKIAAALLAHVDEDAAIAIKLRAIDEARPQDQREAERATGGSVNTARLAAAMQQQAPLAACKANAKLAEYQSRTKL